MKTLRLFATALLVLAFSVYASGQTGSTAQELAKIGRMLSEYRVSADYSYTAAQLTGKGSLVFNGKCFRFTGNGMQVYCDGTTVWTVDSNAKEVYVDSAGSSNSLLSDPQKALEHVTALQSGKDSISGKARNPSGNGEVSFRISRIMKGPLTSGSKEFTFSTAGLGKDWVVTDLRTE